jgi:hypothetical protein
LRFWLDSTAEQIAIAWAGANIWASVCAQSYIHGDDVSFSVDMPYLQSRELLL